MTKEQDEKGYKDPLNGYGLPRLARPVAWWEILIVAVAWLCLLALGWLLSHVLAVPKFWSTAVAIILGSATVAQLIVERWAGLVDGHLDTESRRKRVKRKASSKKAVDEARSRNRRLREGLTTTVFWLAVLATVALGANLAGEAVEAGLTCYPDTAPLSWLIPSWHEKAVCEETSRWPGGRLAHPLLAESEMQRPTIYLH